jgi:hypothetical protein
MQNKKLNTMTTEQMNIIINIQTMQNAIDDADAYTFSQLYMMDVKRLRDVQYQMIDRWNEHLKRVEMAKKLRLSIDEESVNIYVEEGDETINVVYWHIDEVKEDPEVALIMAKAIDLFYTKPIKLLQL